MSQLTVRKIGNSVGAIFPKQLGLNSGEKLNYHCEKDQLIIDLKPLHLQHDRDLIEESFADFDTGNWVSESTMEKEFGKYGWGK